MKRTNYHIALILLAVFFIIIGIYLYYSDVSTRGTLEVRTYPEGAQVYIDGKPMGETPIRLPKISLGLRKVELKKEGFETYTRFIQFQPLDTKKIETYLSTKAIGYNVVYNTMEVTNKGAVLFHKRFYIATVSGSITAIEIETNSVLWTQELNNSTLLMAPSANDAFILIPDFQGNLFALSHQNGTIIWQKEFPSRLHNFLHLDNRVIILSGKSTLTALDNQGDTIWQNEMPGEIIVPSSIHFRAQHGIGLTTSGMVFTFDLENGDLEYTGGIQLADITYSSYNYNYFAAVNNTNDINIWDFNNKVVVNSSVKVENITSLHLIPGLLLAADGTGVIFALDLHDGTQTWQVDLFSPPTCFAAHNGTIIIGCEDGSIFLVDADRGEVLFRKHLPGRVTGLIASDYPVVYSTNRSGQITVFYIPEF